MLKQGATPDLDNFLMNGDFNWNLSVFSERHDISSFHHYSYYR